MKAYIVNHPHYSTNNQKILIKLTVVIATFGTVFVSQIHLSKWSSLNTIVALNTSSILKLNFHW